jgi:hypothetical protein
MTEPNPDVTGDALAHALLAPVYEAAGIELPVGSARFGDLVPDVESITDPAKRSEAEHVRRLLLDLRAGIEAHRQAGDLP